MASLDTLTKYVYARDPNVQNGYHHFATGCKDRFRRDDHAHACTGTRGVRISLANTKHDRGPRLHLNFKFEKYPVLLLSAILLWKYSNVTDLSRSGWAKQNTLAWQLGQKVHVLRHCLKVNQIHRAYQSLNTLSWKNHPLADFDLAR